MGYLSSVSEHGYPLDNFLSPPPKTIQLGTKGYIEGKSGSDITDSEIQSLYELERDMWSHGLGEYVRCGSCNVISSKSDVFGKLDSSIRRMTVSDIERLLDISTPPTCPCCSGATEYVFGEEYIDDIASRYTFKTSFVTLHRDIHNKIRGFMDGYVAPFDSIYSREFEHYYSHIGKGTIVPKIAQTLGREVPSELLCITALGVDQENASMFIIYHLMKQFFDDVLLYDPTLDGIYESVLGTNTHAIYEICGGSRIFSTDGEYSENVKEGFEGDIFVHDNIGSQCVEILGDSLKSFMRANLRQMKEILEKAI